MSTYWQGCPSLWLAAWIVGYLKFQARTGVCVVWWLEHFVSWPRATFLPDCFQTDLIRPIFFWKYSIDLLASGKDNRHFSTIPVSNQDQWQFHLLWKLIRNVKCIFYNFCQENIDYNYFPKKKMEWWKFKLHIHSRKTQILMCALV